MIFYTFHSDTSKINQKSGVKSQILWISINKKVSLQNLIILLVKRQTLQKTTNLIVTLEKNQYMKPHKSSDKIVMIAQQILKESTSRQGIDKLNKIKKSLEIRSSKTRTKSHEKSKQKIRKMSSSSIRKVPESPRAITEVRKRSMSKPQEINAKSYSKLVSTDQEYPRTRKRSVRFSLQHQPSQNAIHQPRSPLKQHNHSQKTILKQSSLKKPASPRQNTSSQLPTAKQKSYFNNFKPTLQNFSVQHIVAKKIFGNETKQKPIIQSEISFNLNLNKLLQTVQKVIEAEKGQKQNVYGSRKDSLLSKENMKLIRKIGKKLNITEKQDDLGLEQNFSKRKYEELKQSTPLRTKQKQTEKPNHIRIDYISQESEQGSKTDQNQFKVIELKTVNNSQVKKDSRLSSLSKNLQEEFSVTTQKYESIDNLSTQQKSKTIKQDQMKQLNERLDGLRKDKEWLVQTVECLLSENEQLKKLLVANK